MKSTCTLMRKNGLNNIVVSLTKELFFVFLPFFVDFFKVLQHSSKITKFAENYRKSFSTCIQRITSQNRISKILSITNGRACKNINQCKTADCFFALPKKSLKNDLKEFCMNFGKPLLVEYYYALI